MVLSSGGRQPLSVANPLAGMVKGVFIRMGVGIVADLYTGFNPEGGSCYAGIGHKTRAA